MYEYAVIYNYLEIFFFHLFDLMSVSMFLHNYSMVNKNNLLLLKIINSNFVSIFLAMCVYLLIYSI